MGARASSLNAEDIEELEKISDFRGAQINRLYKRFKMLDRDNSGTISRDELMTIPELAMNPLAPRIIAIFDEKGTDNVDFRRFIQTLSIFSPLTSVDRKVKFVFQLYDADGDGFISMEDMQTVLHLMVGQHLTEHEVFTIAQKTIEEADTIDHDGKISLAEFSQVVKRSNIQDKLTVNF